MKNPLPKEFDELFPNFSKLDKCIAARQIDRPLDCSFEKIGSMEVCRVHNSFKVKGG